LLADHFTADETAVIKVPELKVHAFELLLKAVAVDQSQALKTETGVELAKGVTTVGLIIP
jgi:hypothetical protein